MAERLNRTQPTSSIANAINQAAVRAATDPMFEQAHAPADASPSVVEFPTLSRLEIVPPPVATEPLVFPSRAPTGEPARVMRQFQLTARADAVLKRVIEAYGHATGLELNQSEFLRSVLYALEPTIELHEREGSGIGPLKRPKNEAWLFHKRDQLEHAIAKAFTAAMRAAPARR